MIKSIEIKNVGSFVEFTNNETPFVKGMAVVHGMNGSGKSQLCSLLQLIGNLARIPKQDQNRRRRASENIVTFVSKRRSKDTNANIVSIQIDSCLIRIETKTGSISIDGTLPPIHVFNDDYVTLNVGDTVELPDKPIRIGERNKLRDDLQSTVKKTRAAIEKVEDAIEQKVEQIRQQSGYAGQIRTTNNITKENYLKSANPCNSYTKARAQLENLSTPPDAITSHIGQVFPEFNLAHEEKRKVDQILATVYVEPQLHQAVYQRHLQARKLFYETGVQLFREIKDVCPFCLTPKKSDDAIISELIAYIESEYNDAQNFLSEVASRIEEYKKRLHDFIVNSNKNNAAIRSTIKIMGSEITLDDIHFEEQTINSQLSIIRSKLNDMTNTKLAKGSSIGNSLSNSVAKLKNLYEKKIEIIAAINSEIDKLTSRKRELGDEIIKNCMHEFWKDGALRDRLNTLRTELQKTEEQLSELPDVISGDKTIGFFNQIIRYLGIHKYELTDDSKLVLKLDHDYDISNEGFRISTGEKKFIAFSYFLAEVIASVANSVELSKLSILLDDPIDSSDYQKFYSFVSIIEKIEPILRSIYRNEDISFGQFYIFTHNALLYERLTNTSKFKWYIISNEENRSVIRMPKKKISLITFSSYVKKITNCIKRMSTARGNEIGNYIRRILEIIGSIENIDNNQIEQLNSFSKLNAISNHLSHESIERLLDPLPESHEYIDACIELVELIKDRVPQLYQTIMERYLDSKEISEYRSEYEVKFKNA